MIGNDLTVRLALDGRPFEQGLNTTLQSARKSIHGLNRGITDIGRLMKGLGAVMVLRQIGREIEAIRDIVQETPDLFDQGTIDRVESMQRGLELSRETLKQMKVIGFEWMDLALRVRYNVGPAKGRISHKTQGEDIERMEAKLRASQERKRKVDADLAKLATARERAEAKIRDLQMASLPPAEQLLRLQQEHAKAAEHLKSQKEGTQEYYRAQEALADLGLQILMRSKDQDSKFKRSGGSGGGRLASIGGDVGGLNDRVLQIEREQVRLLKSIETNTKPRPGVGTLDLSGT